MLRVFCNLHFGEAVSCSRVVRLSNLPIYLSVYLYIYTHIHCICCCASADRCRKDQAQSTFQEYTGPPRRRQRRRRPIIRTTTTTMTSTTKADDRTPRTANKDRHPHHQHQVPAKLGKALPSKSLRSFIGKWESTLTSPKALTVWPSWDLSQNRSGSRRLLGCPPGRIAWPCRTFDMSSLSQAKLEKDRDSSARWPPGPAEPPRLPQVPHTNSVCENKYTHLHTSEKINERVELVLTMGV